MKSPSHNLKKRPHEIIMFYNFFILLIFVSFLPFSAASAAEAPLVAKIQDFYGKTNSFTADFVQNLHHRESGSREMRQGTLRFKKPLNIYWQTAKPHEETLVVNRREIWDYLPDEEIAYRYSPQAAQDSASIIQVLTGQAALSRDFDVKGAGSENSLQKLLLYPHEPTPQLVEATIWVDGASGRIARVRVVDFYGNANDIALSNFKSSVKLDDKIFDYLPPKGVEIEDRMEKGVQERELFK